MNHAITLAMIVALSVIFIVGSASAQSTKPISLNEINLSYTQGDKILISGSVKLVIGLDEVTIKVSSGDNFVTADQLDVALDGTFATILNTDGGVWMPGDYVITVTYTEGTRTTAEFGLRSNSAPVTEDIFTVDIGDGDTGDIGYAINGGTVREMEIDDDLLSLIVRIDPTSAGILTLDIDRDYLDARANICSGDDESFIVLVDNVEVPYQTSNTDTMMRTIEVAFESDESKIQIIGTCAIPEFGALAMVVLVASISAIIVASRRFAV